MRRLRFAVARYLSITLLCALCAQATAGDAVTYAYDTLGRLVSATADGRGVTYRYDEAGNLTAIVPNNSPLAITALQPGSGIAGTTVTISGTGFATMVSDNTVRFNGVNAPVQSASATQIVAQVPAGAASGNVSVTTAAGTAVSPMAFHVDSVGPPSIFSFTPGVAAPGSTVTISGANFDTSSKVFFGTASGPYRTVSTANLAVDVPLAPSQDKLKLPRSMAWPAAVKTSSSPRQTYRRPILP
jgi:YD repeat-containing protein